MPSSKGDFIVGQADFSGAPSRAFLVRYDDGNQQKGTIVAGVTTPQSVQASVDDLGRGRQQDMILQNALATSAIEDTDRGLELGNGFYLLTNAAYSEPEGQSGDDDIRAGGVRYLHRGVAGLRRLIEVGGWTEPNATFRFQREYSNGSGTALGEGFTSGTLWSSYGRTGLVWEAKRK